MFELLRVMVQLSSFDPSDKKMHKKLFNKARKLLTEVNLLMSLCKLDNTGESDGLDARMSSNTHRVTFSQWFHAVVVRPFAPFVPEAVKKVYKSLELEDLIIEMDIGKLSKQKSS
jgi:hypothetical protein